MSKPPRLKRIEVVDLPVDEASGIATKVVDGELRVVVIGDRTAHVAVGSLDHDAGPTDWRLVDLSELDGWDVPADDSQMEAIAVDGGSLVAVMREDPPVVLVADTERSRLVATVTLVVPDTEVLRGWDDPSSRGEGLVMLRGGRLLVAKEKRPRALVEFCPPGVPSGGVARDDFLADGEAWEYPEGHVEFVATAAWRLRGEAKQVLGDISDMAVGRDGSLWLLSDRSEVIAELTLEQPLPVGGGEIRDVERVWRLPKRVAKPEGIVSLGEGRGLVAMDTGASTGNGMIVAVPDA